MFTTKKTYLLPALLVAVMIFVSCDNQSLDPKAEENNTLGPVAAEANNNSESSAETEISALMETINAGLAESGTDYRLMKAEFLSSGSSDEASNIIIAKDVGNKQLGFDFVPNDTRRSWSGAVGGSTDDITYAIDQTGDAVPVFGGLTAAQTTAAIQRAMGTWDASTCSDLAVLQNPDFGLDIGVVAFQNGLGGSPFVFADIQHAGWRDINFAGGVIGATFTFGFTDVNGFTDIDNNGKLDVAFREIYYDPSFNWADDGSANVDVETVALHEAGHGLSQAHFGTVFIKKNGSVKAAPRAVMNATYLAPQRGLLGTDNGGHCSNWGSWPNN